MKIKVIHFCNQLSLGGTERTLEIFCRHLARENFDVHVVSRLSQMPIKEQTRLKAGAFFGHKKSKDKLKLFQSRLARISNLQKFLPETNLHLVRDDQHLEDTLLQIDPQILHVHYSGRAEPPITLDSVMNRIPVVVTTNQFELENKSPLHNKVKRMYFVSQWLLDHKALWAKNDPRARVMYNPCDLPETTANLRAELSIPKDAFVIGRVGRADPGIHDAISLNAYKQIQNDQTWFLALNAPSNMIEQAQGLGLKNFVALPGTADSSWLSAFYNTIDILAHARRDGETFGCNIAEAMMHGKPVVSHLCDFMNAQTETVDGGGYVVDKDDANAYAKAMASLRDDKRVYADLSLRASHRARQHYESSQLARQLVEDYLRLLKA
jgi:glycosyltransferase involved in cell wall biosynthesis